MVSYWKIVGDTSMLVVGGVGTPPPSAPLFFPHQNLPRAHTIFFSGLLNKTIKQARLVGGWWLVVRKYKNNKRRKDISLRLAVYYTMLTTRVFRRV